MAASAIPRWTATAVMSTKIDHAGAPSLTGRKNFQLFSVPFLSLPASWQAWGVTLRTVTSAVTDETV